MNLEKLREEIARILCLDGEMPQKLADELADRILSIPEIGDGIVRSQSRHS